MQLIPINHSIAIAHSKIWITTLPLINTTKLLLNNRTAHWMLRNNHSRTDLKQLGQEKQKKSNYSKRESQTTWWVDIQIMKITTTTTMTSTTVMMLVKLRLEKYTNKMINSLNNLLNKLVLIRVEMLQTTILWKEAQTQANKVKTNLTLLMALSTVKTMKKRKMVLTMIIQLRRSPRAGKFPETYDKNNLNDSMWIY